MAELETMHTFINMLWHLLKKTHGVTRSDAFYDEFREECDKEYRKIDQTTPFGRYAKDVFMRTLDYVGGYYDTDRKIN